MDPASVPPPGPAPRAVLPPAAARWLRRLLGWALVAAAAIYLARAFDARRMAPLEVWHTARLTAEFKARDARADYSFGDFLAQEARLRQQLEREVHARVDPREELALSRFRARAESTQASEVKDWNRTFELEPQGRPRGAALLLHGLSDSPYSLRSSALLLQGAGLYVVGLRLPGHGTAPAALARVHWRDWAAAVRLGAAHASECAQGGPLFVVGYSAGGALAVRYAAEAALDPHLPRPQQLVLLSPALGITAFARAGNWHRLLSWVPYFERFAWQDVEPEYDAFKYNSFPKNAGWQMHALAADTRAHLAAVRAAGKTTALPPVLAFQSLADDTVSTAAVFEVFSQLASPASELVVFDVNARAALRPFLHEPERGALERAVRDPARDFRLTHVVNRDAGSSEVAALSYAAGSAQPEHRALGLDWPEGVYSLSHVAMPFAPDDAHYGNPALLPGGLSPAGVPRPSLGTLAPRGERRLLRLSLDDLLRLRCNPFHAFVEERITAALD